MELSGPGDVEKLLVRLGLPSELVLGVYQYGSRVTGTAWAGSDWDFTIVVDDSFEPTAADMCQGRAVVVDNVDANVHHKAHFIELIRAHDMRALTCLWLPPQHVWRQTVDFASYFHLDLSVLRNPVSTISSKAFGYATICFREGHSQKAKKNLIHSIRYLLYGIQIAERGRIDDFSDGNEYYYGLVRPAGRNPNANVGDDATNSPTAPAPAPGADEGEGEDEEALRDEYRRIAKDIHARFDRLLPPKAKRPRKPRRRKEKNGGADAHSGGEDRDGGN